MWRPPTRRRVSSQQQLLRLYEVRATLTTREVELQNQLAEQAAGLNLRLAEARGGRRVVGARQQAAADKLRRDETLAATARDAQIAAAKALEPKIGFVAAQDRIAAGREPVWRSGGGAAGPSRYGPADGRARLPDAADG
jgi:hypothetical protein